MPPQTKPYRLYNCCWSTSKLHNLLKTNGVQETYPVHHQFLCHIEMHLGYDANFLRSTALLIMLFRGRKSEKYLGSCVFCGACALQLQKRGGITRKMGISLNRGELEI